MVVSSVRWPYCEDHSLEHTARLIARRLAHELAQSPTTFLRHSGERMVLGSGFWSVAIGSSPCLAPVNIRT